MLDFVQVKYKIHVYLPQVLKTRNLFQKLPEYRKYFYKVSQKILFTVKANKQFRHL